MNRLFFDTETTGLLQPKAAGLNGQPYIIEFYGVIFDEDFNQLEEFETYIHPPIPVPSLITKINRIDDLTLLDAPIFADVAKDLSAFFSHADEMIAHNLAFDKSMVGNEAIRAGYTDFPFPEKETCTVQQSMSIEQRRISLSRLHEILFGKTFEDAHRAKSDVTALVRCYRKMLEMGI